IIQLAQKENVELILIAGDLFDVAANGRLLEAAMLPIWEQFQGSVLIVPGNHDDKFLNHRSELAPNVIVANQTPYSVAEIEGLYFVCVPYQHDISLSDINIPNYDPAILVTHGTYESGTKAKYFPISSSDVAGRYRYVALGHYHTWFDRWTNGTCLVNPGAPRQTRKSDIGARYVSLIDTDSWAMERLLLPIVFIDYQTINVSVTDAEKIIQDKLLRATSSLLDYSFVQISLKLQGSLIFSKYSLSQRLEMWKDFLMKNRRDVNRITWDLTKITQISSNVMHASFSRLMVDKISEIAPKELDDLAPFLFERLQYKNQKYID
ncbi:MAG: metallophosphoesterase family protein, partial [Brevinema sp.]